VRPPPRSPDIRTIVECAYLRLLASAPDIEMMRSLTDQELEFLQALADISIEDAQQRHRLGFS